MRPNTPYEAYERMIGGEPSEKALSEFLDTFYGLPSVEARLSALTDGPPLTADDRLDALAAAIADYLAKKHGILAPTWTRARSRFLSEPWFTAELPGSGVKEFLWHSSPAEFRSRNIFTDAAPLRRAAQR